MKQLTLILLLFLGQTAFSQLQVTKVSEEEDKLFSRLPNKADYYTSKGMHVLRLQNDYYKEIDDYFYIVLEKDEFQEFIELLKSYTIDKDKEMVSVEHIKGKVYISFSVLGVVLREDETTFSNPLGKKALAKLFDK